jgi:hypothetical protein
LDLGAEDGPKCVWRSLISVHIGAFTKGTQGRWDARAYRQAQAELVEIAVAAVSVLLLVMLLGCAFLDNFTYRYVWSTPSYEARLTLPGGFGRHTVVQGRLQ